MSRAKSSGALLWLVGAAAGVAAVVLLRRRSHAPGAGAAAPRFVQPWPVSAGPAASGSQPIVALDTATGAFLKRDPSGGAMCFAASGARAPLTACAPLEAALAAGPLPRQWKDRQGAVHLGSLGSDGLGSLGGA